MDVYYYYFLPMSTNNSNQKKKSCSDLQARLPFLPLEEPAALLIDIDGCIEV